MHVLGGGITLKNYFLALLKKKNNTSREEDAITKPTNYLVTTIDVLCVTPWSR